MDLNPRVLVDPRQGIRYAATLATRLMQLQAGLLLRAVLVATPTEDAPQPAEDNIRTSSDPGARTRQANSGSPVIARRNDGILS
jgi:hypothetical protein